LHPGINIISGASDSGKSAIRRAIELVVYNRPVGTAYIRTGAEQCKVQMITTTGTVLREKGKGINSYRVNKDSPWKPGTDVPLEVKEILHLDETNIQDQKDLYFLLNLSPGKVAKKLNEVVGLDEMDRALKDINTRARKVKSEQVFVKEEMDGAEVAIKELRWTVQADIKLNAIQALIDEHTALSERMDYIQQAVINVQYQENKLKDYKLFSEEALTKLEGMFSVRRSEALNRLQVINQLKFIAKIEADVVKPKDINLVKMLSLITKHDDLEMHQEDLLVASDLIMLSETALAEIAEEVQELEEELEAIKAEVDICPFCEQSINGEE